MLIYKQRYKPRTTREFTKSDLTVYDSATGNPNALTIYGKSEVVNGAIASAGEGWTTVDLGTLTWGLDTHYNRFYTNAIMSTAEAPTNEDIITRAIMPKYKSVSINTLLSPTGNNCVAIATNGRLSIRDTNYTDVTTFTNSLSGIVLAYPLADPTQGNAIAVKTDDGTGIDGTMTTFSTGTPLRGITGGATDVALWDGTSGEVTKNCAEVDLGTLNWTYRNDNIFSSESISDYLFVSTVKALCSKYTYIGAVGGVSSMTNYDKSVAVYYSEGGTSRVIYIRDTDYTDATAFKTAMSGVKLVYEIATPTTTPFTTAENNSFASLETYSPQTHFTNNANTDMTLDYTIKVPTI